MSNRTMYIIAFSVYMVFVVALVALYYFYKNNSDAMLMGMYMLSSGLMGATVVLGVIFLREKDRQAVIERFEMRAAEDSDWDKKD